MSSEVHAKWTNSPAALTSRLPAKRSRSQYSTAFTSWLVVASIAFTRSASATLKLPATPFSSSAVAGENAGSAVNEDSDANASSHAASIATRSRIRANSLKCSWSGLVFEA